jgi:hypothetical protein
MEVNDQFHDPDALPWRKSPLYPLNRRLDGIKNQFGRFLRREKPFVPAGNGTVIHGTIKTDAAKYLRNLKMCYTMAGSL